MSQPEADTRPAVDEAALAELLTHHRVRQFYTEEARRLDAREFEAWLAMLTDDVRIRVPVRTTTAEGGEDEFLELCHLDDNRWRLEKRVERLRTEHAWAERPASRTRHFVTNIRIADETDDALEVRSNLLLFINRGDDPDYETIAGARHDTLRRTDDGLKLDGRTVYLDHATLPLAKLSVFL